MSENLRVQSGFGKKIEPIMVATIPRQRSVDMTSSMGQVIMTLGLLCVDTQTSS